MEKRHSFELFIFCILIGIGIVYLRLFAVYPDNLVNILKGIGTLVNYYIEALNISFLPNVSDITASHKFIFLLVLMHIVIGAVMLKVFEGGFRKSVNIFIENLFRVIRWGIVLYMLMAMSFLILMFSVAGSIGAVAIAAVVAVISLIGGVSVAVAVGFNVKRLLNIKADIVIMYLLGEFVIAICTSVSVLCGAIVLFVVPVLSLGVTWCYFIDKFIYKVPVSKFDDDYSDKNNFDRESIRNIITGGIND